MNWPKPMPQENCQDECERDSQPNSSRISHKINFLHKILTHSLSTALLNRFTQLGRLVTVTVTVA